jgi:predicted porin
MLGNELGTLSLGRQFTAHHTLGSVVDPFAKGTVGRFDNVYLSEVRADNMLAYASPAWSGFSFNLGYSLNSKGPESLDNSGQGDNIDIRMAAFQPRYVRGPLMVGANVHALTAKSDNPDLNDKRVFVYDLMGTYDFGSAKLAYAYGLRKADFDFSTDGALGGGDTRQWMLGVTMPVGHSGRLMTSYAQRRTEAEWLGGDAKVNQWAIGYEHDLSKRTTLYAVYANLNNNALAEQALRDNADAVAYAGDPDRALVYSGDFTCIPGSEPGSEVCTPILESATLTPNHVGGSLGDATNPGDGAQRAINIGIRHRF